MYTLYLWWKRLNLKVNCGWLGSTAAKIKSIKYIVENTLVCTSESPHKKQQSDTATKDSKDPF